MTEAVKHIYYPVKIYRNPLLIMLVFSIEYSNKRGSMSKTVLIKRTIVNNTWAGSRWQRVERSGNEEKWNNRKREMGIATGK